MTDNDLDTTRRQVLLRVDLGDGAVSSIPDPAAEDDGSLAWIMRYSATGPYGHLAAEVIECFDYLLSGEELRDAEAVARLRQLRRARARAVARRRAGR